MLTALDRLAKRRNNEDWRYSGLDSAVQDCRRVPQVSRRDQGLPTEAEHVPSRN
jgi:hypothetical protein